MPREKCWLAEHGEIEVAYGHMAPVGVSFTHAWCAGPTDPCHLIPQQLLKREGLEAHLKDERIIVPGCRKHHDLMDKARKLKIPRRRLPAGTEEFAKEHGLEAWLDREYGERFGV